MITLEELVEENTRLNKRVSELLEANNKYQQAYRDEKLLVKKGVIAVETLTEELLKLKDKISLLEGALEYHTDKPAEKALKQYIYMTGPDVDPDDSDSMEF